MIARFVDFEDLWEEKDLAAADEEGSRDERDEEELLDRVRSRVEEDWEVEKGDRSL